jgi:hypothetical protein
MAVGFGLHPLARALPWAELFRLLSPIFGV